MIDNDAVMTIARRPRKSKPVIKFNLLWNKVVLHQAELGLIATLVAVAGYMLYASPVTVMVALVMALPAIALGVLNQSISQITRWGLPLKSWHLASAVVAVSALAAFSGVSPVNAQMFNNLEQAVTNAVSSTSGSTVDPAVITTIFNIFRILIVLAFLIGVVIVFTQATRGGDWQPIANLLAIGVAFVIGVEVISQLIIGTGSGGPGGAPGGPGTAP